MAVGLKYRLGFDDSLDVVGVHLVGGIVGCLFVGFFGTVKVKTAGGFGIDGLFYGGGFTLLKYQAIGAASVLAYSFVMALIIGFVIDKTIGFRLDREDEESGVDVVEHAETGYDLAPAGGSGIRTGSLVGATTGTKDSSEVTA